MAETGIVKKIYKWKPITRRPAGRPKSRWEDDVRNELKKMKLIQWAEQVQDRLKSQGRYYVLNMTILCFYTLKAYTNMIYNVR
jgi:hypothetical protein